MGCFPSKNSVVRSRSLRDDFSMSLQRRTVGIPGLEDLFASSSSKNSTVSGAAGDDFLALLCTANTVAMRLREREEKLLQMSVLPEEQQERFTSYESGTDEPAAANGPSGPEDDQPQPTTKEERKDNREEMVLFHETINAWELMAGLEDVADDEPPHAKRAHAGDELESGNGRGFVFIGRPAKEEPVGGGHEGSSCVEQKRLSPSLQEDTPIDKQVISSTKLADTAADSVPTRTGSPHDDHLVDKNVLQCDKKPPSDIPTEHLKPVNQTKPAAATSPAGLDSPPPAPSLRALDYSDSFRFKDSFALLDEDDDTGSQQKGVRRKARARELKPLEVPAFEFKDIQNWLQGNNQGLYDSDPYETPKFGNYIKSVAKARKDAAAAAGELGPLDPDLVASLQDTIDGMTAEEERILKQFVDEFLGQVQAAGASF